MKEWSESLLTGSLTVMWRDGAWRTDGNGDEIVCGGGGGGGERWVVVVDIGVSSRRMLSMAVVVL